MNAVDRNTVAPELHRECLCHVHHCAVACAAAEVAGITRIGAADVDDAAPALLLHQRQDSARAPQRTHIFDVEILDQVLVHYRLNRTDGSRRPARCRSAIDEDIYTAHLPRRRGDHLFDLLTARYVSCNRDDPPIGLGSELFRRRCEIRPSACDDRYVDAFASQFSRDCLANSTAAASYNCMLTLQSEIHGACSGWGKCRLCSQESSMGAMVNITAMGIWFVPGAVL